MDGLIGITSSVLATTTLQPIDVVKTRVQLSRTTNNPIGFTNATGYIYKLGPRAFYKGLLPNLGTYPIFWGVFFQTNGIDVNITDNKYTNKFIKSQGSSAIASLIANPLFVFKTRVQGIDNNLKYTRLFKSILKNEGIGGFYKGMNSTLLNNFKLGIQFPLYDYLKDEYNMNTVNSSLISKAVSTSIFYPFDLIRVNQRFSKESMSIMNTAKVIYSKDGFVGLYRGMILYNMISTPNFILMMVFRDILTNIILSKS